MPPWKAINHGLTGIATGGFSVTADSFQSYGSMIKSIAIVVMLLGAVSFNLHYLILARRDFRSALQQSQLWTFVVMLVLGFLGFALITVIKDDLVKLIDRVFQWASAFGPCGFASVQVGAWTQPAVVVLTLGMIVGGMGGATTGGLKLNRVTWLAKAFWWRLRNFWLHEDDTEYYVYNGKRLSEEQAMRQVSSAAVMGFLWFVTLTLGTLILFAHIGDRYSSHEILFETVSALGSVGLSVGMTGTELPSTAKLTLIMLMWMGRLEI
jgi:trk system potassium uptake protein TrkH